MSHYREPSKNIVYSAEFILYASITIISGTAAFTTTLIIYANAFTCNRIIKKYFIANYFGEGMNLRQRDDPIIYHLLIHFVVVLFIL